MSPPKSGRTVTVALPLSADTWMLIYSWGWFCDVVAEDLGWSDAWWRGCLDSDEVWLWIVRVPCGGWDEIYIYTLAKWPTLLQWWHATLNAGNDFRPPEWKEDPHSGQVVGGDDGDMPVFDHGQRIEGLALQVISTHWYRAASCARHFSMAASRVRSLIRRRFLSSHRPGCLQS